MQTRRKSLPALVVSFAIVISGCKDDRGGAESDSEYAEPHAQITLASNLAASIPAATPLVRKPLPVSRSAEIKAVTSVSNDPDLVSGNDVLVEVQIANPLEAARDVMVTLNGVDVTSEFDLRRQHRMIGLVSGLEIGENTIIASSRTNPSSSAQLIVRNHPSSGPVFSGPHIQPWICAQPSETKLTVVNPENGDSAEAEARISGLSNLPDSDCDIPQEVSFYYQPASTSGYCRPDTHSPNACFIPFDVANPPLDNKIARFKNDRGDTVRKILAVERGALNRGMYYLMVYHDPEKPHHPAQPQKGWNNKLIVSFKGNIWGGRYQIPSSGYYPDPVELALRAGYMFVNTTLNDYRSNFNHAVGAEALMMLKERIVETYGPIRYTVGIGTKGGSTAALSVAASYPGLINGLVVNESTADELTMRIEASECALFSGPSGYLSTIPSDEQDELALSFSGHFAASNCVNLNQDYHSWGAKPDFATNCGEYFPSSLVFHPTENPGGLRCSHLEHNVNLLGSSAYPDGVTRANQPMDNVGVQYGLMALRRGTISPERFVHLNENIGQHDGDFSRVPGVRRNEAKIEALERAYRSGMVTNGRHLASVAIIDMRPSELGWSNTLSWRVLSLRKRLTDANGRYDNHVIWAYSSISPPQMNAFTAMDRWLESVEADGTDRSIAEKVAAAKPADVTDQCLSKFDLEIVDVGWDSPDCPVKFGMSPRQVAGGPLAEDVLKCQLKPLDLKGEDYTLVENGAAIVFTPEQKARLQNVFANGVCDWTKPGVGQQASPGWMSFADGPDGTPLELTWYGRGEQ